MFVNDKEFVQVSEVLSINIFLSKNYKKYHWIQKKIIQYNIIASERKKMIANERNE